MTAAPAPRIVLVTGASGAIGGEVALREAAAGATVIVHGRTADAASAAAMHVCSAVPGAALSTVAADFGEAGAIAAMMDGVARDHGRLDALLHCLVASPPKDGAGMRCVSGRFGDTDPAFYDSMLRHAVSTLQQLCHAALPLLTQHGGAIVTLTSDAGLFAAPGQSLIGPSRAAVVNFTRNLALDIARDGVRINCISLTYVEDTPIFDMVVASGSTRPDTARKRAGLGLPRPRDVAALAISCTPRRRSAVWRWQRASPVRSSASTAALTPEGMASGRFSVEFRPRLASLRCLQFQPSCRQQ